MQELPIRAVPTAYQYMDNQQYAP